MAKPNHRLPKTAAMTPVLGLYIISDTMQYPGIDRVMPILPEEQIFQCQLMERRLFKPGMRVLDAGCGSGVFGLYAARQGCEVWFLDKSPRALQRLEENFLANESRIITRASCHVCPCGPYTRELCEAEFFDVIMINAPYHPTPPDLQVALHAQAGEDGLAVFAEFIQIAACHLKPGGRIFFNQMTPSKASGEMKIEPIIRDGFGGVCSLCYTRILPMTSNAEFLHAVYGNQYAEWIYRMTQEYAYLDLVYGEITKRVGRWREFYHTINHGRTWQDRINLHRQIVATAVNK